MIREATLNDLEEVRTLFREYAASLNTPICFQGFERELADLSNLYDPILISDPYSGCVAYRQPTPTIGEMKRLYVRPQYRGQGLGRQLTEAAIATARQKGCHALRLDTLPHLTEAIALYRQLGFRAIEPYNNNPAPGVLFLELSLD